MSKHVFKDPVITVNGTDMSVYINKAELSLQADDVEVTAFQDTGHRHAGGLFNDSLALSFRHDATYSAVDGVIFPLLGTVVAFTVKAKNSATSTDNPEYQGNCLIQAWKFGGSVGENPIADVTWPVDGHVVRDVTP